MKAVVLMAVGHCLVGPSQPKFRYPNSDLFTFI
jgi:hypothetical protein